MFSIVKTLAATISFGTFTQGPVGPRVLGAMAPLGPWVSGAHGGSEIRIGGDPLSEAFLNEICGVRRYSLTVVYNLGF